MARLFKFILFTVIAYFVFKFLNRLFSNLPKTNNSPRPNQSKQQNKTKSSHNIHWDAETVDYEEVETKDNEKK